jgi:hypothetical protein
MSHALYELDVRLRHISPPIWRTIELGGASTLEDAHFAIQIAMGWTNSHLHQFVIGKRSYGMVDVDEGPGLEDERAVRLQDIAKQGDELVYEYDFGDGWEHDVKIQRVTRVAKVPQPRCTEGERTCPPEDCGGPLGYADLLHALAHDSPEHAERREWAGDFQPEGFELPKGGRNLRRDMEELKALGERDQPDEGDTFGLPRPFIEAVLALDPMQCASLAALIAGSLAEELVDVRNAATQLLQNTKPARRPRTRHRR